MSEPSLIHRPALGAAAAIETDRIRLAPLPEGAVLQVFASEVRDAEALAKSLRLSLRANGPGQWYLVGDEPLQEAALADLPPGLSIVDQSHGRVRLALAGPAARDVLAKGSGLDLSTLDVGDATTTLIGHVAAHITRVGPGDYEIMPLRGFAADLWHELTRMSAEFIP